MEKEFVTYEQALALKELGFNEPCFAYHLEDGTRVPASYSKEGTIYPSNADLLPEWCTASTFSQAFRWFRDKHKLVHRIDKDGGWWICAVLNIYDEEEQGAIEMFIEHCYPVSYEEAESACLDKLIEIVKNGR